MFRVATTLTDNSALTLRRYDDAARAGVVVSSQHLLNELRKAYQDYYTTGDFRSTLQIRQALRRSNPERGVDGWYALVGVPTKNVTPKGQKKSVDRGLVALGWELGHNNLFLGKRVRVQIVAPAAAEAAEGMRKAWARTVKRMMEAP